MSKEEYVSLFICGRCRKDTRKTDRDVEKVRVAGFANILCRSCIMEFEDELADLARRYLRAPKPRESK